MSETLTTFRAGSLHPEETALPPRADARPARNVRSRARSVVYTGRLALSEDVRRDAFRVRYQSYSTGGHIESSSTGLFKDAYDDMPNASTMVIYEGDVALASVRTCTIARGTDLRSPARDAFPEEVDRLLNADTGNPFAGRGIEVTRLVRSPEAENNQGLVFLLYRLAGYIALCAHSQVHLACVRANHTPFYRRLGYEAASQLRPYPGLTCEMRLMASDRQRYDKVRSAVPAMDPLGGTTGNLEGFFRGEPVTLTLSSKGA